MKKILIIFSLFLAGFTITSCEKDYLSPAVEGEDQEVLVETNDGTGSITDVNEDEDYDDDISDVVVGEELNVENADNRIHVEDITTVKDGYDKGLDRRNLSIKP